MNAPEPYLTALLRVIYYALLDIRVTAGLANGENPEVRDEACRRIVSLTNVTHNIPMSLTDYEGWNEETFRKFLHLHDQRFPSGIKLLTIYEEGLKSAAKP